MRSLQKISFSVFLSSVLAVSSLLFIPTKALSALPKKKLEIIIGGDNFCKDDKDCAGDSFCNMTSHICISCPTPFEWIGGTQCVCPDGTVPNADNTDCVECTADSHCQALKGNLHWTCDTDVNTCVCLSGLHEEKGGCVCDNPNQRPDENGNCICQLEQSDCPNSDFTGTNDCNCCPTETPKWNGLECRMCEADRTYNPETHSCECINGENEEGQCCADDEHLDGGICCPFGQKNYNGTCACENLANNCGRSCCNGIGEICKDKENSICCANELCNGICCPTNSVCKDNVCVNPCQEGEVLVNYFDTSGKKYQTCCPEGTEGADSSGTCCPSGLVGAFGHNHYWVYTSKCCPKEGQEDKGMVGLRGLSETYTCAPPDTTMDASANPGAAIGHTWYVPKGAKNVRFDGWACAPETTRGGVLHDKCGAGIACQHGWRVGVNCSYCYGETVNGICQLPDCTKPRQHLAYCNCNSVNNSVKEHAYQGGTWGAHYAIDICVTPSKESDTYCTKNLTFLYSGTCYHCGTYFPRYYTGIKEANICLNCPQAVWKNDMCLNCPIPGKPTADRSACEGHYLATNNIYYACDNASQYLASTEQECDSCGDGVRIWRSVYKDCISCNYPRALISTKDECLECDNRYWTGTNEKSGYCYLCPTGQKRNQEGKCE